MKKSRARVKYVEGLQFVGTGGDSNQAVLMDGHPAHGGKDAGVRPMETLLIGLGGCMGMSIISILKKKRQHVTSFEISLEGIKDRHEPGRFTDITVIFHVKGFGVDEEAVKRSLELAKTRYCPVGATLQNETKLDFAYEIEEDKA